jgi:hypothetical protein
MRTRLQSLLIRNHDWNHGRKVHKGSGIGLRFCSHNVFTLVGAEGFEPPTLCSQSRCATRLRHAPTFRLYRESLIFLEAGWLLRPGKP